MSKLCLYMLGASQAEIDGLPADIQRRKVWALLVYLAVTNRPQRRDSLATLFWPEESQSKARAALTRHLSELRKAIGAEYVTADRETVNLIGDIWLDVRHFRQLVADCRQDRVDCLDILQTAASLYRADFLAGFTLPDCPDFDEWQFFQTEELRQTLAELLNRLILLHSQRDDPASALPFARRLLALDLLHEPSHRTLMQLYAQTGQQSAALRQYQLCVDILADELGVDPSPETTTLAEQIRTGQVANIATGPDRPLTLTESKSERPRHNLPQRLTTFVGREKEIAAITELVTQHRLVMLTGVGGIGKTELSLQVGRGVVEIFPGGVWFVELAPVTDPNLVPQITAAMLGLREPGDQSIEHYLLDHLREKHCLLILDNCEHLINGVARFAQTILQHCANVRILASSREVLGVAGERPFLVLPLTLPPRGRQPVLEEWQRYEAVRLFVERAQIVLPDFEVTADNAAVLAHICARLDGIPLALELAAARMKILTAAQIADRLDDRFRLLTGGSRAALPRQQTLRALIDWSWELLTDAEQLMLQRLSVFVSGISLEAVETVCSGDGLASYECLDLLHELVNKSLLIAKREQGQETHYHLLETIRQYAQEKLAAAGATEIFQQRHLTYYRQFAETAAPFLRGPSVLTWLDQLEEALDNIRVALDWAQEKDVENGLRLIFALTEFCWVRGNIREMEARLGQLLAQTSAVSPVVKANGIWLRGWFNGILHHHVNAIDMLEESLSLYRAIEDQAGAARALAEIGHAQHMRGEIEKGHVALREAIKLKRSLGDTVGTAWSLMSFGEGEMELGRHAQAWACFQESVSLFRESGNLTRFHVALLRSGLLATEQGDFEVALAYIKETLSIMETVGITSYLAYVLQYLGKLYFQLGDYPLAQTTFEESLSISRETESYAFSYDWTLVHLGHTHLRMGNLPRAKDILCRSCQQFENNGDTIGTVYALEGLASVAVQQTQPETAVQLFAWADMTRQLNGSKRPPSEQTAVDHDIASLETTVDKESFAVAHAAGRRMTTAQAIAKALCD